MAGRRGKFVAYVIEDLERRAGGRCSFPGCNQQTFGPSDEGSSATSNNGVACHIYAAADQKPARRRAPHMSDEELSSIENGIWMCATHARDIDNDETLFTPEILKHWASIAVLKARLVQHHRFDWADLADINSNLSFPSAFADVLPDADIRKQVRFIYDASAIAELWGAELSAAVREYLFEHASNAIGHGGASNLSIVVGPTHIEVRDNGKSFTTKQLLEHSEARGGSAALRALLAQERSDLLLSDRRLGGENILQLSRLSSPSDALTFSPCSTQINLLDHESSVRSVNDFSQDHSDCRTIYLVAPEFLSFSDAFFLERKIKDLPADQDIVIVCDDVSWGLVQHFGSILPRVRLMRIKKRREMII